MRLPLLLFLRGSALLRKSSRKAATPTHLLTATSLNASSSLAAPAVPCAVLLVGEGDFSYAADACRRAAQDLVARHRLAEADELGQAELVARVGGERVGG